MRKFYLISLCSFLLLFSNHSFSQQDDLGKCCIYLPGMPDFCKDNITVTKCIALFISSGDKASDVLWSRDHTCGTSCPPSTPRRLELENFNSVYQNDSKSVDLVWQVQSLENNLGFFVERSNDGEKFKRIGFLNVDPNSTTPNRLNFTDVNPFSVGYYRLVQLIEGSPMARSAIISVFQNESRKLVLTPNPATNRLRIQMDNMHLYNSEVSVFDFLGRPVLSGKIGLGQNQLNISNLPKGVFTVRVNQNGKIYSEKLIIK